MKKSTKWIFFRFLANILLTSAHKLSGPYFECGPHGRFEYCIDNIPGCVIGCHCHPGYYFDTETKVCEPNGKLQQRQQERQYRRQYVEDVIPIPKPTAATEMSPTPTTTSIIDKNVDAIAKDTDDLGDWLYNQFFKTLENQVMNKTEDNPTRRSGTKSEDCAGSTSKPIERNKLNLQTRRSNRRRHGKRMVKKRHSKKGLRRKLLRISEDDSLFDSSSRSSESSGSSSSYSSESSSEDDSESRSRERSKSHNHGRKILMINKKPPIPLPSFIFMPNMETPYFPPLGLPAPPPVPVPMYPMIPVPPMVPMPMPPSPTTESAHTTDAPHTEAHTTDHPSQKTEHPEPEEHTTSAPVEESEKPEAEEVTENAEGVTQRSRSSRKFRAGKGKIKPNMKAGAKESIRDRFIKRVHEKMMARHQMKQEQPYPHDLFETFIDKYPEFEVNEHADGMYGETNPHSDDPAAHNVNFKYLSELIHKLNNTDYNTHTQPHPMHLLQSQLNPPPDLQPNSHPDTYTNQHINSRLKSHPNSRPNVNSIQIKSNQYPHNNKIVPVVRNQPLRRSNNALAGKDDYADLGRQIAALVRKIDGKGDRQVSFNFEREGTFSNIPTQAILNDNGFSSRSYWERFARSPFKIRFTDDNFARIDSNEKLQLDQLSLEDQINKAATTPRALELHQLENIIGLIQLIKSVRNKQIKMEIPKAPTKMSLMAPLKNYTDKMNSDKISHLEPKNPNVVKSFIETRSEKNIYNITQDYTQKKTQYKPQQHNYTITPQKTPQQKPLGRLLDKPLERLLENRLDKPLGRFLERPVGNPLAKPLEKSPKNLIVKSQEKLKGNPQEKTHEIINHKKAHPTKLNLIPPKMYNPNGFIKDKNFKYSNLLNIAAQRFNIPLSRPLQHAIQPISARLQSQNLNNLNRKIYQQHLHKNNHKTGGPNNGIYRYYENLGKAPNVVHGNQNKPSSYFRHNHFDDFD